MHEDSRKKKNEQVGFEHRDEEERRIFNEF